MKHVLHEQGMFENLLRHWWGRDFTFRKAAKWAS